MDKGNRQRIGLGLFTGVWTLAALAKRRRRHASGEILLDEEVAERPLPSAIVPQSVYLIGSKASPAEAAVDRGRITP